MPGTAFEFGCYSEKEYEFEPAPRPSAGMAPRRAAVMRPALDDARLRGVCPVRPSGNEGTTMEKNPEKGYVALLGWSLNAIEGLEKFDRRYVVVAPDWAEEFARSTTSPISRGTSSA